MNLETLRRTPALALAIAIPMLSVIVGAIMLYLAISTSGNAQAIQHAPTEAPLSKTSWRGDEDP